MDLSAFHPGSQDGFFLNGEAIGGNMIYSQTNHTIQLTVDLMYGLPDLSQQAWLEQLNRVIGFGVNHISAYCLTVEEKTVLASRVKSGKIHPSTADQQSEQFELLVSTLAAAGFEQYEISNFAREGHYSQHNTAYWQGKKYVAIGPSAHGFDGKNRYWNVANNQLYIQRI